jgi:hypothetical protein
MVVNVERSTFLLYIDKQRFLFLVLRDTDDQIRISVDEEIKTIVVIATPCPSSTLLSS